MEQKLNKLVSDFCVWQENAGKAFRENELLHKELKNVNKRSILHQEAAQANLKQATHLRDTVDKLQRIIVQKHDLEEENRELKNSIDAMKTMSAELEDTHSCQMTEALENLHGLSERHKTELASVKLEAQCKLQEEMETKEKEIQDKVAEIKLLRREKAELEQLRHTDIVKLRLEYDAKMLKIQKQQNTQAQQAAQPTRNDIFRKKLQHMKAESEKEIAQLKRKIEQLESRQRSSNKKSRLL